MKNINKMVEEIDLVEQSNKKVKILAEGLNLGERVVIGD